MIRIQKIERALIFLDCGSGEEEMESTAHESLEESEMNDKSNTPFGLQGKYPNFLLLFGSDPTFVVTS